MKFLEAQQGKQKESIMQENKMQPGSRTDQKLNPKDPASLVSSTKGSRANATKMDPSVQKLASQLNVDLHTVTGTGENGAITESDVRKAHRDGESGSGTGVRA